MICSSAARSTAAPNPGEPTSRRCLLAPLALAPLPPPGPPSPGRTLYLRVVTWSFAFFNSIRVLAYLPTLWTLAHSADSSQQSLWTWCTWFFAHVTMSLWLIERNGSRLDRAALISICNATMCMAVIVLVVVKRL